MAGGALAPSRLLLFAVIVSAVSAESKAQDGVPLTKVEARLRGVYERREFAARSVRPLAWLPDGSGVVTLEERASGSGERELMLHNTRDGRRSTLLSIERLLVPGRTQPLTIEDGVASPDGIRLLLLTNARSDPGGSGRRLAD